MTRTRAHGSILAMRRATLAVCLAVLPSCLGSQGPALPQNVGMSHRDDGSGAEDQAPAEQVDVGTAVWADFRGTGFFLHGVVAERREEQHRVIYADGASGWVDASALRPDTLREDARVQVRLDFDAAFAEGIVARRLGDAIYVRFARGEERWTALPEVRFQSEADGVPRRGDEPIETGGEGTALGATVLVNYQSQGLRFAGVVTAVADDGRLHVVYLDGELEWIDPRLAVREALAQGDEVHVRRRWEPPEWVRGRIQRRVGDAIQVELDDGGLIWSSLFRARSPVTPTVNAPAPSEGEAPE